MLRPDAHPMQDALAILCPYCGERQPAALQCRSCMGRFDPWSLRASQNDMGAWFVRDARRPHFVGFRLEALVAAVRSGEVGPNAIVRGPTTRQMWTLARRVPGLAHFFGRCDRCQGPVLESDPRCKACGNEPLEAADHNFLGLPPFEPVSPPRDARPDLSAFLEDSRLLLIGLAPVRPPGRPVVRVSQPETAEVPTPGGAIPLLEPLPTTSGAASPQPSSATMRSPAEPSPIDRSLVERAQRLERINRVLFASTGLAVVVSIVLIVAYARQRESHAAEVAAARTAGAAEVRAEFVRTEPVVVPPPPALPPMPTPASGDSPPRR